MPVRPPKRKVTRKPIAHSIGVAMTTLPPHIVPIQLKNFTPVGTAMSIVMTAKNGSSTCPVDVHVVRPDARRQGRDGDRGEDEGLVAEDRLAREDRQHLADDAEERQRDDVDLRVPEEPEQVLPEHGPAVLGVEDVRPEPSVGAEGEQRGGEDRERR